MAVVLLFFIYLFYTGNRDDIAERKAFEKRKEAAMIIAEMLHGHRYWLNNDARKPFGEMLDYICLQLKENAWVNAQDLRNRVDEIIDEHSKKRN